MSVVAYTGSEISQASVAEGWSGQVTDETVVLKSPVSLVEKDQTVFITLTDRGGTLPELEDIWVGRVNGAGQTLHTARIEIQDWGLTGVVSGALEARLPTGVQVYERFWVDLSSER